MPVSMTGFGRFETNEDAWTHVWEIKSVNGRFLDVKWRMPGYLRSLENGWEKVVRQYASRGRVDISLNLEVLDAGILGVTFNETMAKAMFDQMEELAASRGEIFTPDYNKVLSMSSLWRDNGSEPDPGLAESLTAGLEAALKDWVNARSIEGDVMVQDLLSRLDTLRGIAAQIAERIPDILEEKKANLRQRIVDMLESAGADFSEDRMLQEVAHLTDKLDVSEELTRLDAHLERLSEVLNDKADAGKKLDFLLQETFREINTCGNKAQDTTVSRLVVDFKAELERCREQVQNIEWHLSEEGVRMQKQGLLNVGFGNFVVLSRVVSIVSPSSAPMRRLREDARADGRLIDATQGRKTRAIIVTDSNHVILSAIQAETIGQRFSAEEGN